MSLFSLLISLLFFVVGKFDFFFVNNELNLFSGVAITSSGERTAKDDIGSVPQERTNCFCFFQTNISLFTKEFQSSGLRSDSSMVLILDGSSGHVSHL